MNRYVSRWSSGVLAFTLAVLSSCAYGPETDPSSFIEISSVEVLVVDERGDALDNASVVVDDTVYTTDGSGRVVLDLSGPIVAQVSARRTLVEPVAIAPTDPVTTVRLWDRVGPDGRERMSMHFGGDVMLGRRYLEGGLSTIQVQDAEDARRVVEALAPLSSAADWTVVNLETVVGELPDEGALDGKRFLLQSTPLVTEALDEMGVDLVTLGNNHAYDWGDPGIDSTLDVLDAAGIEHAGAGRTIEEAVMGTLSDVGSHSVGTISFTTVNGSFVNDQLPVQDEPVPDDLPDSEAWQYEDRVFGFVDEELEDDDGNPLVIETAFRRIGEAWSIFDGWEGELGHAAVAELWDSMLEVYPELQDWVARRGHGGAAPYSRSAMEAEITRLRDAGADTVTVQIHGGYQFAEVPSAFLRTIARRAIDAGADLVIAHHPHILQGVEWYDGKLIAYSLGNLVFDQDFLATFPSAMLRIVSDGHRTLEARMLPVMLDRYRPVPVTGGTARQIIRTLDHRSALAATSARVDGLRVGSVLDDAESEPAEGTGLAATTQDATLVFERNSGVIISARPTDTLRVIDSGTGPTELEPCTIVRSDLLPQGIQIGTDLFDWGRFDDDSADGRYRRPLNWSLPVVSQRWDPADGSSGEPRDRSLRLFSDPNAATAAQISARIDIRPHRLFDSDGHPLDTPAQYEVLLDVKRSRGERPSIRMISFHFDDTDPTEDPDTARLNEVVMPVQAPADGDWHRVTLTIPDELFAPDADGLEPNAATLLIDVPPALRGTLDVDNLRIVEWRGTTVSEVPVWVEGDLARSEQPEAFDITTSGC